jgi:hypothetical protein
MSIGRNVSTNLIRNVYYSTQSQKKKGTSAMFTLTSCWRRLLLSYSLLSDPASLILNAHFCVLAPIGQNLSSYLVQIPSFRNLGV